MTTQTVELDRDALETEYRTLLGMRRYDKIDGRWSAKRLATEIEQIKAARDAAAVKKAAEDARAAELAAKRQALAATRGTIEEFAASRYTEKDQARSKEEQALAYFSRRFIGAEEALAERIAKFQVDVLKHLAHAMEWSSDLYSYAAKVECYRYVKHFVESGMTAQELQSELTRRVLDKASSPSRSTSVPSNYMDSELTSKLADLLRDLNSYLGRGE